MFEDALAIELPFVGLDREAQARLNEMKLYAMTHDHLVTWEDLDVLEFGAGHGRFAVELQAYRSYLGVDYSERLVTSGRKRLDSLGLLDRADLIVGDCMEYDGDADSHDLVCCLGMLPYVEDYAAVIAKMAYHTRPGGMILVDFRHATPIYTLLRQIKWRLQPQTGGGSRAHSKRGLTEAFEAAGLTDIRFMMREYPLLDGWYAEKNRDWALSLRQMLAHRSWLDWLGMIGFAAARKRTFVSPVVRVRIDSKRPYLAENSPTSGLVRSNPIVLTQRSGPMSGRR